MSAEVLLVGTGFMGRAYAEVLNSLGHETVAIGRSEAGAAAFAAATGLNTLAGGLPNWLARGSALPSAAIVCVNVEESAAVVDALLEAGMRRILVEKPGGASAGEIAELSRKAEQKHAKVLLAYNRRFYASVAEVRRRVAAEGGVTSFHFEFTERERDATSGKFSAAVQARWALANSSHIIDLAFFLGGEPQILHAEVAGALPWHPSGAQFAGCGRTVSGALFSYCANWSSAGRWGVEVMTRESRLVLRPLEQLQVQRRGSFALEAVTLDTALEERFKPGLHAQTSAFLEGTHDALFVDIGAQERRAAGYFTRMTGET